MVLVLLLFGFDISTLRQSFYCVAWTDFKNSGSSCLSLPNAGIQWVHKIKHYRDLPWALRFFWVGDWDTRTMSTLLSQCWRLLDSSYPGWDLQPLRRNKLGKFKNKSSRGQQDGSLVKGTFHQAWHLGWTLETHMEGKTNCPDLNVCTMAYRYPSNQKTKVTFKTVIKSGRDNGCVPAVSAFRQEITTVSLWPV